MAWPLNLPAAIEPISNEIWSFLCWFLFRFFLFVFFLVQYTLFLHLLDLDLDLDFTFSKNLYVCFCVCLCVYSMCNIVKCIVLVFIIYLFLSADVIHLLHFQLIQRVWLYVTSLFHFFSLVLTKILKTLNQLVEINKLVVISLI